MQSNLIQLLTYSRCYLLTIELYFQQLTSLIVTIMFFCLCEVTDGLSSEQEKPTAKKNTPVVRSKNAT